MSSTNINVGFPSPTGRNSSRVLKPPGGGHTDIFGIYEEKKPVKPVKPLQTNNVIPAEKAKTEEIEKVHKEENTVSKDDNKANKHEEQANKEVNMVNMNDQMMNREDEKKEKINNVKSMSPPQRVRVPPGGYSSGLW